MAQESDLLDAQLLMPIEVARIFRVSPKTVTRWAKTGKLGSFKTLGGHHRFHRGEVIKALQANYTQAVMSQRLKEMDTLIAQRSQR